MVSGGISRRDPLDSTDPGATSSRKRQRKTCEECKFGLFNQELGPQKPSEELLFEVAGSLCRGAPRPFESL